MSSLCMFLGESLCLIALVVQRLWTEEGLKKSALASTPPMFSAWFLLPTVCDLGATTLGGLSLLFIPASIYQMMRGASLIFSGILSIIFLKKKMRLHNWIGMPTVAVGLAVVGVSSLLGAASKDSSGESQSNIVLGLVFILSGQLLSASQIVLEEVLLKRRNYEPLNVVGVEGAFGSILMTFLVLPVLYFIPGPMAGSYENALDAYYQVTQNSLLAVAFFVHIVSVGVYNFFALNIIKKLSAVHRALMDACKTISIFIVALILNYSGLPEFGEAWNSFTFLQVLGFVVVVGGTLLYSGVPKLPCSVYEDPLVAAASIPTKEEDVKDVEEQALTAGQSSEDSKAETLQNPQD